MPAGIQEDHQEDTAHDRVTSHAISYQSLVVFLLIHNSVHFNDSKFTKCKKYAQKIRGHAGETYSRGNRSKIILHAYVSCTRNTVERRSGTRKACTHISLQFISVAVRYVVLYNNYNKTRNLFAQYPCRMRQYRCSENLNLLQLFYI